MGVKNAPLTAPLVKPNARASISSPYAQSPWCCPNLAVDSDLTEYLAILAIATLSFMLGTMEIPRSSATVEQ